MSTATQTDRIEKEITLRAPRARVWQALTDSQQFGEWFGMAFDAPFTPGAQLQGRFTIPGKETVTIDFQIGRITPESYFSYRWHPFAMDPAIDYSQEPTTLIEFRLEEIEGGTLLKVVESGFDALPFERRELAFSKNNAGWVSQLKKLDGYVTR